MLQRIRYWRVDVRAGTLRSPIERDGPLPWPLRTGRGASHAHAHRRAIGRGRPLTKRRAKRVRHRRKRESRSAGTHRLSERIAAVSASLGPVEPPRWHSRAARHHHAPGPQTAGLDCRAGLLWARPPLFSRPDCGRQTRPSSSAAFSGHGGRESSSGPGGCSGTHTYWFERSSSSASATPSPSSGPGYPRALPLSCLSVSKNSECSSFCVLLPPSAQACVLLRSCVHFPIQSQQSV